MDRKLDLIASAFGNEICEHQFVCIVISSSMLLLLVLLHSMRGVRLKLDQHSSEDVELGAVLFFQSVNQVDKQNEYGLTLNSKMKFMSDG